IEYIGLRPGEKLYEEVFHGGEGVAGTSHPKIMLAQARLVDWEWLKQELIALREAAEARDRARLLAHLQTIVPEFTGGGAREEESRPAAPLRLARQAEPGPVQKIGRDGKKILTGARGR
ncbi:MAG: polysaccharide biosynthesis protein, partial [Desulfobacteraceae bacterium]|nr:polysaccharide biosynthesis protein [Desulfobacteraceae bacterium]